ncbi:Inactive protein RESTRICTED TEV MOVEMENT 1 [Camellia lanceoleosa]|uniref:Inactive protein RESTRICTED TEV MOVEMENT 1 n=1 Tax=Camellia lanceoleosa TaxID=1840588 RepID=A0ACC0HGJ6_9ERIC|nr:Inactive protein RESTRICTED TEV MOVEMENT 1 [Camellia lanceoleosa]
MFKLSSNKRPTGKVWDHKGKTELLQIFISHDGGLINCLQFLYVENGNLVVSERLGGSDHGRNFNTVTLNYPDEFLTSISGSSTTGYTNGVSSITFGTNQGSHGPFGKPGKDDMEFNFQLGKYRPFGGFHGSTTSDGYLESIGVYVKPIASLSDLNSAGKVKRESRISCLVEGDQCSLSPLSSNSSLVDCGL